MLLTTLNAKELPRFNRIETTNLTAQIKDVFKVTPKVPLDPEQFQRLTWQLTDVLPTVVQSTLIGSLSILTQQSWEKFGLDYISRRLAGSVGDLRHGKFVALDFALSGPGWCAVTIVDVQKTFIQAFGGECYKITADCWAGAWAGVEVEAVVKPKNLWYIAVHIGFSRRDRKLKYGAPLDLIGMTFVTKVEPSDWPGRKARMTEFGIPPLFLQSNRKIVRGRGLPCPKNKHHGCWKCRLGLDACNFACRQYSDTEQICPNCGVQGWVNPRYGECYKCHLRRIPQPHGR